MLEERDHTPNDFKSNFAIEPKIVGPRKVKNILEISLDERPQNLAGPIIVEDMELVIEYGAYPPKV